MQSDPLSSVVVDRQASGQAEEESVVYDFSECTRIKKLTTHDIFKFNHENDPLVVKLFAPEALPNYQQEVSHLKRMNSPSILNVLYSRSAVNPVSCQPLEKSHLIVMKEASRGDLNDYIPRFGRMTEKMARTLFIQLLEGLESGTKLKPAIVHPNLQASSILLDESARLYICGWSEMSTKEHLAGLQECIFSCGEILFCMLTSFMPFYKKYSSTDVFFKFIASEQPHKFWQEIQKKMIKIDKTFAFSPEVKKLIENIFLKKTTAFSQIWDESWSKGEIYSQQQLLQLLKENEKVKLNKIAARRKQQSISEEKRRKVLTEFQLSYGQQRSSPEEEQFINDYQEIIFKEEKLPQGSCNIKVEGSPGFIVACLRSFLRSENGNPSALVGEQFVLSNHKVVKVNNYILIDLIFSVSLFEEEEEILVPEDPADTVSLKLKLSFFRNEKQTFAEIEALESNFNSFYTTLAMRYLEQRINRIRQFNPESKVEST